MTALTRRDVLAHQAHVPWPSLFQVEQDLLLCRSMHALFNDAFLRSQIAMRGGTLLHKVYLAPATRYSEDIDLVVIGERPEDHIHKAIRRVLRDVLGVPKASVWGAVALAIRNHVKPSRVLGMTYAVPCISEPGMKLTVVVEANVSERKPHRPIVEIPFEFFFRDAPAKTQIQGFDIHEMLGTKMRALFQRRRGRDLFDLYQALTRSTVPKVDPGAVVESFQHYLRLEQSSAGRSEFMGILDAHLADRSFRSDMDHLLRLGVTYNPMEAGIYVKTHLLKLLPK